MSSSSSSSSSNALAAMSSSREANPTAVANGRGPGQSGKHHAAARESFFQMPLHYPRYTRADYETMAEWKLDCLLAEYGLHVIGNVAEKRSFAMGAFLWN